MTGGKRHLGRLLLCALLAGIAIAHARDASTPAPRSYLALPLGRGGEPASIPYVWERRQGGKHLVVVGTRHSNDPDAPMFARIDAIATRLQPQLVLHESQAPDGLGTLPREQAIRIGADVGHAAVLAVRHGASLRSGDAPVRAEIAALLAKRPAHEVLVFMAVQRHIGRTARPDFATLARDYPAFFADYLVANGLPRKAEWATWDGLAREYARVVGVPLTAADWDRTRADATRRDGALAAMARETNAVRDRALLDAIRSGLRGHDRVLVVFGSWHVLAVEPLLPGVMPSVDTHAATRTSSRSAAPMSPEIR